METHARVQTDVELMRQVMADVKILGTAFEAFAIDYNSYPTATESVRTVGGFALSEITSLSKDLKIYARSFPKVDPWDSPYLFWSDGQHYALVSLGADAALAAPESLAEALQATVQEEGVARRSSHCIEDEIVSV